jgi:hypothetical protein
MSSNAATLRMVVYDLLNDFKQIYPDAPFTPFKILFWVLTHADRLRKLHTEKIDSGAYIYRFDNIPVLVDSTTGRNYFELPANIYDFDGDKAVDYITYHPGIDQSLPAFSSVTFTRTTPAKAARLYFREDERPTPANPYFYRQNKNIYLLGVEEINITKVETGLKTTLEPASLTTDIDVAFDFPQDLLPTLKRQVLDLGRFALQLPADLINDGTAIIDKAIPTQKLVSVNDLDQQNQQQQ